MTIGPTADSTVATDSGVQTGPTVAACQIAVADLDVNANVATVTERVNDLPPKTDVAVFPEYALTGFVGDRRIESVALDRDANELAALADLAASADCALSLGFVESAPDAYYNATVYVTPDGETTVYRKRHLWDDERDFLEPGRERVTVETPVGTTGLLTCYDLNFVRESAAFARSDVDALFVGGAWPAAHDENWDLLLRARALDGVRWVVGAGRTGRKTVGDPVRYAGRSGVVRPDGSVQAGLERGDRDLVAELDPAVLASCRETIPIHADDRRSV